MALSILRAGQTGVLYEGQLTPFKKRAARLIRQALCINLGRIFTALSVHSWEIYRPSSSVRSWPPSDVSTMDSPPTSVDVATAGRWQQMQ